MVGLVTVGCASLVFASECFFLWVEMGMNERQTKRKSCFVVVGKAQRNVTRSHLQQDQIRTVNLIVDIFVVVIDSQLDTIHMLKEGPDSSQQKHQESINTI